MLAARVGKRICRIATVSKPGFTADFLCITGVLFSLFAFPLILCPYRRDVIYHWNNFLLNFVQLNSFWCGFSYWVWESSGHVEKENWVLGTYDEWDFPIWERLIVVMSWDWGKIGFRKQALFLEHLQHGNIWSSRLCDQTLTKRKGKKKYLI